LITRIDCFLIIFVAALDKMKQLAELEICSIGAGS